MLVIILWYVRLNIKTKILLLLLLLSSKECRLQHAFYVTARLRLWSESQCEGLWLRKNVDEQNLKAQLRDDRSQALPLRTNGMKIVALR